MPRPRRVALMLDLEWPYKRHAGIFAGVQRYAQEQGWESIIDEYAADTIAKDDGRPAPYDGIIARATRTLARRAARRKVPVVNVWRSSPAWKSLPGVFPDHAGIGRLRAEHLVSRGFCRFATLISDDDRGQDLEVEAFAAVLREGGFPCAAVKMPLNASASLRSWRKTERTIAAWMKAWQPPIGVYIGGEPQAGLVMQMCRNRGWRIPEDVAIVAGWNEETFCEHLQPTLTSVEVGYERIGYEAGRLLHRLMDRRRPAKNEHVLLPPQGLVVRESTDFFAVDHPLVRAALEFIAANGHRPIRTADVARAVATGLRTLERCFRAQLDRPISAEIRRVRLERAKRELAQSGRQLAEIARDVGFGPEQRMYQVFRRELGVTPRQYRKQRRGIPGSLATRPEGGGQASPPEGTLGTEGA